VLVFLPADEPDRSQVADGLARFLAELGQTRLQHDQTSHHSGYLISTVNGIAVAAHPFAHALHDAGFHPGPLGMHLRRPTSLPPRIGYGSQTSQRLLGFPRRGGEEPRPAADAD